MLIETFASCACAAVATNGMVPAASGTLTSAASATLDSSFLKAMVLQLPWDDRPSGSERHFFAMVPAAGEMPRSRKMSQLLVCRARPCSMLDFGAKHREDRVAFK